ncbi:MAG: hypothetical protein JWQ09_1141 [Segetibacter sp.]|nr:hypothetical protein [Segetibacter sp.]
MSVKAKMKCDNVNHFVFGKEVVLNAVYGSGENADFNKATPSGQFKMMISNDVPASDFFTPGKSYYLTIEECE